MPANNSDTNLSACAWIAASASSFTDGPKNEYGLAMMLQRALEAHHDHNVLSHSKADGSAYALLLSTLR
jgi:hypothetical protein